MEPRTDVLEIWDDMDLFSQVILPCDNAIDHVAPIDEVPTIPLVNILLKDTENKRPLEENAAHLSNGGDRPGIHQPSCRRKRNAGNNDV